MKEDATCHLISIDPGSSDKGWTAAEISQDLGQLARITRYPIERLGELIALVLEKVQSQPVLLALDVPLKAFGGVQSPVVFAPEGYSKRSKAWPFDVNPFSQRPCEKALTSRPGVLNRNLEAADLPGAIAGLCSWTGEYKQSSNMPFAKIHEGLSVMGYMSAPHAPVVRTFLDALRERAARDGFALSFEANQGKGQGGLVTVLETHPAVTLAFLCAYGAKDFPATLPVYKPAINRAGSARQLADALEAYIRAAHGVALEKPVANDDELDAMAGLLNLLDLASGMADIFGTERDGYFLVPGREEGPVFKDLWLEASRLL